DAELDVALAQEVDEVVLVEPTILRGQIEALADLRAKHQVSQRLAPGLAALVHVRFPVRAVDELEISPAASERERTCDEQEPSGAEHGRPRVIASPGAATNSLVH